MSSESRAWTLNLIILLANCLAARITIHLQCNTPKPYSPQARNTNSSLSGRFASISSEWQPEFSEQQHPAQAKV